MYERSIRLDYHPRCTRHSTTRHYPSVSNSLNGGMYQVLEIVPFQQDTCDNSPQYSTYHDNSTYTHQFNQKGERNLGICTPAFSQAWINAAPCSTMTFLPSIVISISALREAEMENGRHCWIRIEVFVGLRAAMTALRRSISPPCDGLTLDDEAVKEARNLLQKLADITFHPSQSEGVQFKPRDPNAARAGCSLIEP